MASSAEICAGDYVGVDIGGAGDEVVNVLSVGRGTFTAHSNHLHAAGTACRVLPRARHFGRVLKHRVVDTPAPDYGEQPASLAVEQFTTTNTSCELKLRLVGQLQQCGREANGMPVRVSVDGENQIVRIEKKDDEFGATSLATASVLKIHGPGSNPADSTLLELTANCELILAGDSGNGSRLADMMPATNPSGWSGVIKVQTRAGATLGSILLHASP